MSIRIQNDGLAGAAAETGRAQDIVQIGNGSGRIGSRRDNSGDRVEISSLSGQIAEASSTSGASQANRVRQLAALYQAGRYQVDSMAVSRALVSNTLQSGGTGGE